MFKFLARKKKTRNNINYKFQEVKSLLVERLVAHKLCTKLTIHLKIFIFVSSPVKRVRQHLSLTIEKGLLMIFPLSSRVKFVSGFIISYLIFGMLILE